MAIIMKRILCFTAAVLIAVSVLFAGCSPAYDKSPDQFTKIRWSAPDYSFIINPSDGCKGTYKFNDTKYNIKAEFDGSHIIVQDTDKNKELFFGEWMYDDEDRLYVYNLSFNTDDYKDLKSNFAEFVTLNREPLK